MDGEKEELDKMVLHMTENHETVTGYTGSVSPASTPVVAKEKAGKAKK